MIAVIMGYLIFSVDEWEPNRATDIFSISSVCAIHAVMYSSQILILLPVYNKDYDIYVHVIYVFCHCANILHTDSLYLHV